MLNASEATPALPSSPVPVASNSPTTSVVAATLNSTCNTPTRSTREAAVRELADVIRMAHHGYDDNAALIKGWDDESWDLDSDHLARDKRRFAQAQSGIDPGRSSPSGIASAAILRLVEEGYECRSCVAKRSGGRRGTHHPERCGDAAAWQQLRSA
ncbi:hypothetical protein [Pinirhizobacter soli]|uniref:hypothetical protein n=1 Tax=Pinirhizobacter soli TaxID=2786953 RepID=UPI00202A7BA0|nr:hypothetical protein [Pinirhizobacter soli]